MDWSNERYVCLYTRDTPEWAALEWQARALFYELMRKVDRAGVLPLGKSGLRGLAGIVRMPLPVVEAALPLLLDDGCVVQRDTTLVLPNFMPANEASRSDKQRQRDSRERRRAEAMASVTKRDLPSQDVTKSHVRSHAVTPSHTPSLLSDPIRSELCLPEQARAHTHTRAGNAYVPSERQPSDPLARDLLAELRKHPSLAEAATPALAETLAMAASTAAKRPEDVRRAIGDAAAEVAVKANVGHPLGLPQIATLLRVFCNNASPPKTNGTPLGANGRPKVQGRTYNRL